MSAAFVAAGAGAAIGLDQRKRVFQFGKLAVDVADCKYFTHNIDHVLYVVVGFISSKQTAGPADPAG